MVGTVLMCVCMCVLNLSKCNELCVVTDRSLCQNELADDTLTYSSLKCWDRLCVYLHFLCILFSYVGGCLCYQHYIKLQSGIHGYYYDLSIFICERTTRVVYFTIDGEFFKLVYSLYYWDDVTKIFNDGLVHMSRLAV